MGSMPTRLRVLCTFLALQLVFHAALSPTIEEGYLFLLPVAVDIVFLWMLWDFVRRRPGAASNLSTLCIVAVVMGVIFGPFVSDYGDRAWIVGAQIVVESVTWLCLYFALRMPSTKAWLSRSDEVQQ